MLRMASGNAWMKTGLSRRMKPARQTRPTWRASSRRPGRGRTSSRLGYSRWLRHNVSMPARRARSSPGASARLEIDDADARIERAGGHRVDDRLQVAAATGNEHA